MNPDTEEEEQLTPARSIEKLEQGCSGCSPEEGACCSIAALVAAGWRCEAAWLAGELHMRMVPPGRRQATSSDSLLQALFLGCVSNVDGATPHLVALRQLGWTANITLSENAADIQLRRMAAPKPPR